MNVLWNDRLVSKYIIKLKVQILYKAETKAEFENIKKIVAGLIG